MDSYLVYFFRFFCANNNWCVNKCAKKSIENIFDVKHVFSPLCWCVNSYLKNVPIDWNWDHAFILHYFPLFPLFSYTHKCVILLKKICHFFTYFMFSIWIFSSFVGISKSVFKKNLNQSFLALHAIRIFQFCIIY